MKTNISTDISQSKRLLSCGVDPKTADMHWSKFLQSEPFLVLGEIPRDNETGEIMNDGDIPAWSLSALLGLLPPQFKPSWPEFDFYLQLRRNASGKWEIAYDHIFEADSPIEACVQMIEWLTANGYSLNKTEE